MHRYFENIWLILNLIIYTSAFQTFLPAEPFFKLKYLPEPHLFLELVIYKKIYD